MVLTNVDSLGTQIPQLLQNRARVANRRPQKTQFGFMAGTFLVLC
jgi:hypothetical protein